MKCPVDGTTLSIAERNGIEIDYCPNCRGVWLDRGELDKIIDRNVSYTEPADMSYSDKDLGGPRGGRRRKKGLLGEIFDFLD